MKNTLKEIKRLKSLQRIEAHLEPKQVSTMERYMNILNGFLFLQYIIHHKSSTGLYIDL